MIAGRFLQKIFLRRYLAGVLFAILALAAFGMGKWDRKRPLVP